MTSDNYVYLYERLGRPLYVGIGSGSRHRALSLKTGHEAFVRWCREKFGGTGRVKIRIVADDLTRKQARLVESVLIMEHSRHHEIFNQRVSIVLTEKYVARNKERRRTFKTEEEKAETRRKATERRRLRQGVREKHVLTPNEKRKERALYQAAYRAKQDGNMELHNKLEAERDALRFVKPK